MLLLDSSINIQIWRLMNSMVIILMSLLITYLTKTIFLLHPPTNEFLDSLLSHKFLSHILQAAKVYGNSKTVTDNSCSNMALPNIISGNSTATLSYHFLQFLIAPNIFLTSSTPISNKYERDWSRFGQENFILDYFSIDWDDLLLASNMILRIYIKLKN